MNDFDKIATPRGDARSMTSLSEVRPNIGFDHGGDWFGPSAPIKPIAPPDVAGRAFDYAVGFNLSQIPRSFESIPFGALRHLADAYDPVRLIIERRKDQMCRLPWTIRIKRDGPGSRPKTAQLSAAQRRLINDVTNFFRYPTEGTSFRAWLRAVLEDVLVIDAPAIFCERDDSGGLTALSPIDGASVKLVIDSNGRRPRPRRWDGTAFDFLGQKVTTANYESLGFKIEHGLLQPVFAQQILKGVVAGNFSTADLVYAPMNPRTTSVYGRSPVEMIVTTISTAMRRATSQFEYFREGNVPEGVFCLPENWTPDNVQRFQDAWDNMLSGNLSNRRKLRFIPSSNTNPYQAFKEPPLKNEFDEWLVRIVCFAFSYPPNAFVALSNRSIADQHERQAEEEGIEPLKQWLSELINGVIEREFDDGIEFSFVEENEIDPERQAKILTRYTDSGVLTINQARERIGEEPDPDPNASKLMVRTPTGLVPIGAIEDQVNDGDAN